VDTGGIAKVAVTVLVAVPAIGFPTVDAVMLVKGKPLPRALAWAQLGSGVALEAIS
jgi:hypothetical protein